MDDDDPDTQWTDEARDRFRATADDLVEAVKSHVSTVSQLTGRRDEDAGLLSANRAFAAALRAYDEATFDLSGTFLPGVASVDDEEEEEEEEVEPIAPSDTLRLSVEARFDFVVRDEARFVEYVRGRFLDGAVDIEPEHVEVHVGDAVGCLSELFRMDQWKVASYQGQGLEAAGDGYSVGEIDKALFEMTYEEREQTGF